MLPADHRLTDGDLFRRVSRRGRRAAGGLMVVHRLQGRDAAVDDPRVGFVVSKAVGIAVVRNRVRRRLRHATVEPQVWSVLGPGDRVVVRALPAAAAASYAELRDELSACLRRSAPAGSTS